MVWSYNNKYLFNEKCDIFFLTLEDDIIMHVKFMSQGKFIVFLLKWKLHHLKSCNVCVMARNKRKKQNN